jgi:hypothetical protein
MRDLPRRVGCVVILTLDTFPSSVLYSAKVFELSERPRRMERNAVLAGTRVSATALRSPNPALFVAMQANRGRGMRVGFPTYFFLPLETVSDYLHHTGRTAERGRVAIRRAFLVPGLRGCRRDDLAEPHYNRAKLGSQEEL